MTPRSCSQCGTALSANARYCPACGTAYQPPATRTAVRWGVGEQWERFRRARPWTKAALLACALFVVGVWSLVLLPKSDTTVKPLSDHDTFAPLLARELDKGGATTDYRSRRGAPNAGAPVSTTEAYAAEVARELQARGHLVDRPLWFGPDGWIMSVVELRKNDTLGDDSGRT